MKNPLTHWRKSLPIPIQTRKTPLFAMQAVFDKFLEDFYKDWESPNVSFGDWENLMIHPSVDIIENEKEYKVEVEVPGMGPEDLKILIADHVLTIKGEKTTSRKDKDQNYMMREIAYGAYQRDIPLPESVDTANAKASFKKGMLWVSLPKKENRSEQYRELKVENSQ